MLLATANRNILRQLDIKTAITRYCNYQERCHQEVRNKLFELGCKAKEVEEQLSELITQGVLNEERYACAIARGRFRIKQWGRNKIVQHLKQNRISDYCIKKGLQEIDPDDYFLTLERLAEKKWYELRTERNTLKKKNKLFRYLLQKGFESDLIHEAITGIINKDA